jgi:hypothetical protein
LEDQQQSFPQSGPGEYLARQVNVVRAGTAGRSLGTRLIVRYDPADAMIFQA